MQLTSRECCGSLSDAFSAMRTLVTLWQTRKVRTTCRQWTVSSKLSFPGGFRDRSSGQPFIVDSDRQNEIRPLCKPTLTSLEFFPSPSAWQSRYRICLRSLRSSSCSKVAPEASSSVLSWSVVLPSFSSAVFLLLSSAEVVSFEISYPRKDITVTYFLSSFETLDVRIDSLTFCFQVQ